jgi:AraC family transcriptional regulator
VKDFDLIQKLVGNVTHEQLRYVDCAVTADLGVFMPVAGQCYYAVSPCHTHPSYLFTITFDRHCRIKMNGTIYESVPATVSLIPPGIAHQELPSESVSRYLAVMIDKTFFERQLAIYYRNISPELCAKPIAATERLVSAVKSFLEDYEDKTPGYQVLLAAATMTITHLLIRLLFNLTRKNEKITSHLRVNRAIEYINTHYGEKITLTDLAHIACLSPSHFTRIFKNEIGCPPVEYILKTRLDMAKRMLRSGDKPVTTIALDCGFNSSSYFSHCFLRAFNTSPSQFKKSIQTT